MMLSERGTVRTKQKMSESLKKKRRKNKVLSLTSLLKINI